MQKCKNCSHVCVCVLCHCVQLLYTTQHRAVLIIFALILQTSTRAQTLSIGGNGGPPTTTHLHRVYQKVIRNPPTSVALFQHQAAIVAHNFL